MIIRSGFVSNSSSGSFIFPKGMTIEEVTNIIEETEKFLKSLKVEQYKSGLGYPIIIKKNNVPSRLFDVIKYSENMEVEDYYDRVIVNTISDNSCPYVFMEILRSIGKTEYVHYG